MKTVRMASLGGIAFLLSSCSFTSQVQQIKRWENKRAQHKSISRLAHKAEQMKQYAEKKGYSTRYCFFVDMRLESGLKRFFVYDLSASKLAFSGLVAHGSCEENFLKKARFSNAPGLGCSSTGLYKVASAYYGNYGKAYKLFGLEESNSNAFKRAVVLHGYSCVPDVECYPKSLCNSSGCPMVSTGFFRQLSKVIDSERKPVLLSIYNK